jgi:multisubunit Na+/H+ antiporter MnhF subunit
VSINGGGTTSTTRIPSAVVVALFAYLGTRIVARYGFDRGRDAD